MKISKGLELRRQKHETLGDIFVLYSPINEDGSSAYFVESEEVSQTQRDGRRKLKATECGMGLRLTPQTATRLALQILNSVGREQ